MMNSPILYEIFGTNSSPTSPTNFFIVLSLFCMKDYFSISTHLLCNLGFGEISLPGLLHAEIAFSFQMYELKFILRSALKNIACFGSLVASSVFAYS